MRDLKKLENELRFAADAGCDYTLLLEAADALAEAKKVIDTLADGDKNGKTVYLQMRYFCEWKEMKNLQNYLNRESPDKIVVLPTGVKMLNPEDTEKVLKEFLNIQSPSEECKKHAEKGIVPQIIEWLDGFATRAQKVIRGESNDNITQEVPGRD